MLREEFIYSQLKRAIITWFLGEKMATPKLLSLGRDLADIEPASGTQNFSPGRHGMEAVF